LTYLAAVSNMCSNTRVERRKHWWNGRFANRARRDVYMWRNDGHWHVEASRGALDRRCRRFAFDNELAALSKVDVICGSQGGDGWREVAI
jgi:hypothetical protein